MPFTDLPEGQTHSYNDGCGIPEHNMTTPKTVNQVANELIDNVTHNADWFTKTSGVILADTAKQIVNGAIQQAKNEAPTELSETELRDSACEYWYQKGKNEAYMECVELLEKEIVENKKHFINERGSDVCMACYEDDVCTHEIRIDLLTGIIQAIRNLIK